MTELLALMSEGEIHLPLWSAIPFALLLVSIAVLPLVVPHWWHHNTNKLIVAVPLGVLGAGIYYFQSRDTHALVHTLLEYIAFMSLLGSLFIISGGIRVKGTLAGTPAANTALLAVGGVLANLIGTTGAAMLLIRPFMKANAGRKSRVHQIIFFIFIVANCGGCLTPLGDPPLFLGFLKGVPFEWTLRLWPQWLTAVGAMLALFFVVDTFFRKKEGAAPARPVGDTERFGIDGGVNFLLLLGVIGAVLSGGVVPYLKENPSTSQLFQSSMMWILAGISMKVTAKATREANQFSWEPYLEVVYLFVGIFAAMVPALAILKSKGPEWEIAQEWQFFWATGALSAFLDNAPTYLSFLSLAEYLPDEVVGTTHSVLTAISCGAVFCGAFTYIGNGPNFMVKAIAEHGGIKMPSFLGYLMWSVPILGTVFLGLTFLFFRG